METSINGIGVVGGFGCGVSDLMDCLNRGVSPIPFFPGDSNTEAFYPAYVTDTSYLATVVPKRALRRIDHFSQLALTGAYLAINDAGLDSLDKQSTGLVICSGYGSAKTTFSFLDSLIDFGDACASPTLFSNSVHNAAAGHISIMLGLEGPCLTISQFEMSVPSGLLSAIQWLKEDRVEQVLFGAVDEYCDVLGYCYQRYYGRSDNKIMAPFVTEQQSAIPGEGAAFFLLSKDKSINRNYGSIKSVKIGNIIDKEIIFPGDTFFILNADGHKDLDTGYNKLKLNGSEAACYTPLYGSLPVGSAFDMAVAGLSIRDRRFFSSAESVGDFDGNPVFREECIKNYRNISCVKVGRYGRLSIITLSENS